jgi:hypothetical protein
VQRRELIAPRSNPSVKETQSTIRPPPYRPLCDLDWPFERNQMSRGLGSSFGGSALLLGLVLYSITQQIHRYVVTDKRVNGTAVNIVVRTLPFWFAVNLGLGISFQKSMWNVPIKRILTIVSRQPVKVHKVTFKSSNESLDISAKRKHSRLTNSPIAMHTKANLVIVPLSIPRVWNR